MADMTQTEWGYVVGGTDTDAKTVTTGKLWVKCIAFAGNAADATATITSKPSVDTGTDVSCMKFKVAGGSSSDLDIAANNIFFGDAGIPLNYPIVTLSHADDRLYIYLTV